MRYTLLLPLISLILLAPHDQERKQPTTRPTAPTTTKNPGLISPEPGGPPARRTEGIDHMPRPEGRKLSDRRPSDLPTSVGKIIALEKSVGVDILLIQETNSSGMGVTQPYVVTPSTFRLSPDITPESLKIDKRVNISYVSSHGIRIAVIITSNP